VLCHAARVTSASITLSFIRFSPLCLPGARSRVFSVHLLPWWHPEICVGFQRDDPALHGPACSPATAMSPNRRNPRTLAPVSASHKKATTCVHVPARSFWDPVVTLLPCLVAWGGTAPPGHVGEDDCDVLWLGSRRQKNGECKVGWLAVTSRSHRERWGSDDAPLVCATKQAALEADGIDRAVWEGRVKKKLKG